ncbi:MAG: right-handed parallel beta-helix repeat-containing protein [Clostridia bacterium]|nr:right-handed parallel beta-helix repeat-containing protein [Clostridia bacterium]
MKIGKILSLLIVSVMIFSILAACSGNIEKPVDAVTDGVTTDGGNTDTHDTSVNVIYVDAGAEDGGDGSKSAPYQDVTEAQAKIRELKSEGGLPEGGITVMLADGYYSPLLLDDNDSGEERAPITYLSVNKHGAKITGGIKLPAADFVPADETVTSRLYDRTAKEKLLQIDLKKYGLKADDWGESVVARGSSASGVLEAELYINNERMLLGQYPNEKWITAPATTDGGEGTKADLILDADAAAHVAKWQDNGDIWVHGYLTVSYFDHSAKVTLGDGKITLNDVGGSDVVAHSDEHNGTWFWFYNVLEEIDSPGEYYIDRASGMLYLYAPEDLDTAEIVISVNDGDLVHGTDTKNIIFKDIAFTASRREAIRFYSSENITIDGCLIAGTRFGGVSADGTKITIKNCDLHDIGAYAVGVSGGDSKKLISSENLVYNNKIYDFAQIKRTYNPGISLNGCGGTATHNEIYNAAHTALMYAGQLATFEYNEVYNVCLETLDCGAFYTGRSLSWYGTVIRYNYFHDIGSDELPGNRKSYFRASGIYLDDGLSGVEVYGNIIKNTTGRGIYIGGGRDVIVSNNIIIDPDIFVIEFDSRMWDAAFTDYGWFSLSHLENMTADVSKYFEGEDGEIWREKFPSLAAAKFDYTAEAPDPTLVISPVNNVVTNNIYVSSKNIYADAIMHDPGNAAYNKVETNWPVRPFVFEDYENGNFTVKADAGMWNYVPDFKQIPWQEIGLVD